MPAKGSGGYDAALYQSPIYRVWSNMKNRCYNRRQQIDFQRYGGRGITVCHKWQKFSGFFEDMADTYRNGLTLERIDNNSGYSKQNCRWASRIEQANNRRSNRSFVIGGVTRTMAEWIRLSSLKPSTVRQRFYGRNWPIERALGEVCHR
jgi:hypothetical protein